MLFMESIARMVPAEKPSEILLDELDIWSEVFPELMKADKVVQRNRQTVLEHTLRVLDGTKDRDHVLILSAIAHDLGKINSKTIDKDGKVSFPGHQYDSACIVKVRLADLVSRDILIAITRIVKNHMYDIKDLYQESAIRRFIASVGEDNIDNWFRLRTADSFAYLPEEVAIPPKHYYHTIIKPFRQRIDEVMSREIEYDFKDIMPE